jgi:centractin
VELGSERFLASEILFNPALAGLEHSGLHEILNSSISKLDMDLKRVLYKHIMISGGNT